MERRNTVKIDTLKIEKPKIILKSRETIVCYFFKTVCGLLEALDSCKIQIFIIFQF